MSNGNRKFESGYRLVEEDGATKSVDWAKVKVITGQGAPIAPAPSEVLAAAKAAAATRVRAPTQWAVLCPVHARVYLREEEADLMNATNGLHCPTCGGPAVVDTTIA